MCSMQVTVLIQRNIGADVYYFRNPFPSKNKLYDHLKSTGHAVYLPSSSSNLAENKKAKSKKKK